MPKINREHDSTAAKRKITTLAHDHTLKYLETYSDSAFTAHSMMLKIKRIESLGHANRVLVQLKEAGKVDCIVQNNKVWYTFKPESLHLGKVDKSDTHINGRRISKNSEFLFSNQGLKLRYFKHAIDRCDSLNEKRLLNALYDDITAFISNENKKIAV